MNGIEAVQEIARTVDGKIDEIGILPDGSGFATMSMPLPKDHWLTQEGYNVPPMTMRTGKDDPHCSILKEKIIKAGRYAVRSATDNGKIIDFDPDALINNLVVGFLGYCTPDGLSADACANPK